MEGSIASPQQMDHVMDRVDRTLQYTGRYETARLEIQDSKILKSTLS